RRRRQVERLGERGKQLAVPGAIVAVEVAALVAFTARVNALAAIFLEFGVDEGRNRLIRRRPVAIPAPEDAVLDPREGIGREGGMAELLAESRGVVGWLAVVRGGDDDDGALPGQRVGVLVEWPNRRGEAPATRVVCDAVRDALGRAEIGAEQRQQWR